MVTRRTFLAGALLSLPGASVFGGVIRMLPIREAEFTFGFTGHPMFVVTTYANGRMQASYDGKPLTETEHKGWRVFETRLPELRCRCRVRRPSPKTLDLDSFEVSKQDFSGVVDLSAPMWSDYTGSSGGGGFRIASE